MGLYNRSATAAILDICKLANFRTQTGKSNKEGLEKNSKKSDEYGQLKSVYIDLEYANKSMVAILDIYANYLIFDNLSEHVEKKFSKIG